MSLPDAEIIAVRRADTLGQRFVPVEIGYYPAGEPYIKDVPITTTALIVRPKSLNTLMAALFWIDASADHWYHNPIDLILPYLPGARQDRILNEGDQLFTVRSIGKVIRSIGNLGTLKVLDSHSPISMQYVGFKEYSPVFVFGAYFHPTMQEFYTRNYKAVIAPDKGATLRAQLVADYLELPLIQAEKTRDPISGKLTGFAMPNLDWYGSYTHRYLLVDDICDGGGTFLGLADEMGKWGISADLYVTHGIFSQGTDKLLARYGKIYCSDSILGEKPGVTVIPTVERMI